MSIEKPNQAPRVPVTSETWEGRVEIPIKREYFELQFAFAEALAQATGRPLLEMAQKYTPMLYGNVATYDEATDTRTVLPDITEDTILDRSYENYLKTVVEHPISYNRGTRFGCFYYDYDDESDTAVKLHFINAEYDTVGPLSSEKLESRTQELIDLLRSIKEKRPGTEVIKGNSWLYNIEAYLRLFPESYRESLKPNEDPSQWARGTTIWGQFLDSDCGVKTELSDLLLERARTFKPDTPMTELLAPPLMLPLKGEGSIAEFYEKYGIT